MTRAKSPNYPNYSLRKAVKYAEEIYNQDRRNPIDRQTLAKHMGYSSLSGAADKAISTIMQYGLVEKVSKGEVRTSQLAVDILHPDKDADRKAALHRAGMSPALFQTLKERFPDDRFSEENIRSYLMRNGFLDRAIGPAVTAYSDTVAFLQQEKATESGGMGASNEARFDLPEPGDEETIYGGAAVGDLVQWESNGALQMETSKRVRAVTDDGQWIFVEGSETGIPMEQVIVEQKTSVPPAKPPTLSFALSDSNAVTAGEAEWMHNKVGPDTSVRLLVKGDMGPREIKKLIRLLEAQRDVLLDDEDDEGLHALHHRTIVDVRHFEQPEDGVYILPSFKDVYDYRDLKAGPIWSIGRNKKTGEYRAALDGRFYQNDDYECVWLR